MLDRIALKHGGRSRAFDDFLTVSVCALAGGTMEEEYLEVARRYAAGEKGERGIDHLAALFGTVVQIMEETRADILGDVFQGAITYGGHGQYFTPENLCDLMAQMVGDEGKTVSDPSCGSGRMLLAAATISPQRHFVGQDVDLRCVKITTLNLALHGLYGHVIWGNSLTNERRLVYETGFNGRGFVKQLAQEEAARVCVAPVSAPTETDPQPTQGLLFGEMG